MYDENEKEAVDYAWKVEQNLPEFWDDAAKRELAVAGYSLPAGMTVDDWVLDTH